MTLLSNGIAHVSFAGGGVFLPARSSSDRQSLIANVELRARANGLVQVLVDDQRWIVRTLPAPCAAGCSRCGQALEPACYAAADARAAYCATCVFARDPQEVNR
jgi:hypothetical protein